jgi:hypothetical protein
VSADVPRKRVMIGQRPDGRPLVTFLDTGEVPDWPDVAEYSVAPGEPQILWLGMIVASLVTVQAQPGAAQE